MIIVRSPLRVSFVGGGSDLPGYCSRAVGSVVSTTIRESVYISVNQRPLDSKIRVQYSKLEVVDDIADIEHDIVREALRVFAESDPNWDLRGLEIVSTADLPSQMGLGSSGAFTVGLVQAIGALQRRYIDPYELAQIASDVEIRRCEKPIGYQDQTASAYGGFRYYEFRDMGLTHCEDLSRFELEKLRRSLFLVDLSSRRPSSDVLSKVNSERVDTEESLRSLAGLSKMFRSALSHGDIRECGRLLDTNWEIKSELEGVASDEINEFYSFVRERGAIGGKLCGAGGRGAFLVMVEPSTLKKADLQIAIQQKYGYRCLDVVFEPAGSRVIYSS